MREPAFVLAAVLLGATACLQPQEPGFDPASGPPAAHPTAGTVTVGRVVDGDTLALTNGQRVRLLTVDAPELNARTDADDAECGAEAARDALTGLLPPGTRVDLAGLPGEPDSDRYGRLLANAYVTPAAATERINVSLWLVRHGWARAYLEYRTVETDQALELEAAARDQGVGMWAACPHLQ